MGKRFISVNAPPLSAWPLALHVALLASLGLACTPPAADPDTESAHSSAPEVISPADRLLLASAKIALPPAGLTLADLPDSETPGAGELQKYCAVCHALPTPLAHSATDWPRVVRRMWLRMGLLGQEFTVPTPTDSERFVMMSYLIDNALRVAEDNLPDLPGRQSFESTCTRCHELPDPRQHSPPDWAEVVRRMSGHMQEILGEEMMSRENYVDITSYLRAVSSGIG